MKWTMCFFVRDLGTRQIVHYEVEEIDDTDLALSDRAEANSQRILELMKRYPSTEFEVFLQGFDSLSALHGAWPELKSDQT